MGNFPTKRILGRAFFRGVQECKQLVIKVGSPRPVVQSVVSLTSSLVVKMLTVLVSTISNSQVFLLKKCE